MSTAVIVRHNAEAAHRLPFLGGKCENLHGHSWWFEITVAGDDTDSDGVLIEFATLKRALRDWIDTHLDHGTMLGVADPLVRPLVEHDSKVHVFDPDSTSGLHAEGGYGRALRWPTVENVAELLRRVTLRELVAITGAVRVDRYRVHVRVTETAVNAAIAASALR
jgi:6-pyruvoyltetrahydropterin/6-carboxytetrahydropterin synthase